MPSDWRLLNMGPAQDQGSNRVSLKSRERQIFGTFQFKPPLTPRAQARTTIAGNAQAKRKDGLLQAQRDHRKRHGDYVRALEDEVHRLRSERSALRDVAVVWMHLALASNHPSGQFHNIMPMGPGIFLWSSQESSASYTVVLPNIAEQLWQRMAMDIDAPPRQLRIHDTSVYYLLQNFCVNIAPNLNFTEPSTNHYLHRVIPLALDNDTVKNAFLAASASHASSLLQLEKSMDIARYRSSALRGLYRISAAGYSEAKASASTLATILGLLIYDAISDSREHFALVRLVDSWDRIALLHNHRRDDPTVRFLLDQIQMLRALVHPLYQLAGFSGHEQEPRSEDGEACATSHDSKLNYRAIFISIESAVSQACHIHRLYPAPTSPDLATPYPGLDDLLDRLQSTTAEIPAFAPGEHSLSWVYSTAALRSTRLEHKSFFTLRLAELQRRTGFQG